MKLQKIRISIPRLIDGKSNDQGLIELYKDGIYIGLYCLEDIEKILTDTEE